MHPHPSFVALSAGSILSRPADDAAERTAGRGGHFLVEWVEAAPGGSRVRVETGEEAIVVLTGNGARIASGSGRIDVAPRSFCITDAGGATIVLPADGKCVVVTSTPGNRGSIPARNNNEFRDRDVIDIQTMYSRTGSDGPVVHRIDDLPTHDGVRWLQSATLIVALTEARGQRDRSDLDPRVNAVEKGSLAMDGTFVHHLRRPWGPDAEAWRPDEHVAMYAPTLAVTPAGWISTTEWIGDEDHQLLEIWAPIEATGREANIISNAADYVMA